MKLVHLLLSTGYGGTERVAGTLHQLACAEGIESRIEAPPVPGLRANLGRDFGSSWSSGPEEKSWTNWFMRARRRLTQERPDVVHAHLASPSFTGLAFAYAGRHPLLLTFHLLPQAAFSADRLLRLPSPWVIRAAMRARPAAMAATVTENDRRRLSEYIQKEKLTCVPNAPPRLLARKQDVFVDPWPMGSVRLLSVGRLTHQKGFDQLLRTLAAPSLRDLSWHLALIGEGEERQALESLVERQGLRGKVTFTGQRNARPYLERCDLMVVPSRFEGMPLVLLEALMENVPTIASPIDAHEEKLSMAPASLLPLEMASWADHLAPLLKSETARAELKLRQAGIVPLDATERCYAAYHALYDELSKKRRRDGAH